MFWGGFPQNPPRIGVSSARLWVPSPHSPIQNTFRRPWNFNSFNLFLIQWIAIYRCLALHNLWTTGARCFTFLLPRWQIEMMLRGSYFSPHHCMASRASWTPRLPIARRQFDNSEQITRKSECMQQTKYMSIAQGTLINKLLLSAIDRQCRDYYDKIINISETWLPWLP